jgi:hypothetical protein
MRTLLFFLLCTTASLAPAQEPSINACIIEHVDRWAGKRIGRGECWDLAAAALDSCHADWDHALGYGRRFDPAKEPVLPGDIVQFEGAEFRWTSDGSTNLITMPHHTAIIHKVLAEGHYTIAHQNMQGIGRKVGFGELVLAHRVKGRIVFHRPTAAGHQR